VDHANITHPDHVGESDPGALMLAFAGQPRGALIGGLFVRFAEPAQNNQRFGAAHDGPARSYRLSGNEATVGVDNRSRDVAGGI
jgi:hypothetical protein